MPEQKAVGGRLEQEQENPLVGGEWVKRRQGELPLSASPTHPVTPLPLSHSPVSHSPTLPFTPSPKSRVS
jgi:hypothetical protein